jgi:hypothetical protein
MFFASLKSMRKEVGSGAGSGAGSGSINQRYGSGDPDPHQYATDPQHCESRSGYGSGESNKCGFIRIQIIDNRSKKHTYEGTKALFKG